MAHLTHPARGTRDILPDEASKRHAVINSIVATYQARGFQLVETPSIERIEMLTGGEGGENEKQVFKIQKRGEELERAIETGESLVDLGLRFDLTVPLTRYYAQNSSDLPTPFKAIQIGSVWRAERPQKGRYRQFVQCDIDILGDDSLGAELDLIESSVAALRNLGIVPDVRVNDRRLLTALGVRAGIANERLGEVFIALDKLDKLGVEGVEKSLTEIGIDPNSVDRLLGYVNTMLHNTSSLPWDDANEIERDALRSLKTITESVSQLCGVKVVIDPSLVRGMGYYTGTIIEFGAADLPYSVAGGGRYDQLIGKWSGRDVPACGVSIGFERIIELINPSSTDGPVALIFDPSTDVLQDVMGVAGAMRDQGIPTALVSRAGKLGKQIASLSEGNYRGYLVFADVAEYGTHAPVYRDFNS